tara:strand:- start:5853 stop:6056 length:204 start_codon:yes stop_codon:yes gene_type:complete
MTERAYYFLTGFLITLSLAILYGEFLDEYVPRIDIYLLFGAGSLFGYCAASLLLNQIYSFWEDENED